MEEEVDNKWEERLGTFGKQIKANENVQYFCKNSHDIANKVRSQQIDIRLSMGKVASVGDVKKYLTDG